MLHLHTFGCIDSPTAMASDDVQSTRSTLTSVFHDLLGDGLAKQVAEYPDMVQRTEREGVGFISRQQRETNRGEQRRFSTIFYRRLEEEEAVAALQATPGIPEGVEIRVAAAMHARVPVWHVVVTGVDGHAARLVVSKYFMQNLEELRELARSVLIEFLEDDDPFVIVQAVDNPQFQDWACQWYKMSEDFSDDRSVRYICRLPGCSVLQHCVVNNFGACTALLLERYSTGTAPKPWLVLAEPLRYFGKFQCNAFHQAAYSCAASALEALIRHGNEQKLNWKESLDSEGKTALDIARDRVQRGIANAEVCLALLVRQYPAGMELPATGPVEVLAENVVAVSWIGVHGQEVVRHREVLDSETTWKALVAASTRLLAQARDAQWTPMVIVCKVAVVDADESDLRNFFEMWKFAKSVGFSKCRMHHPDVALHLCKTMNELLQQDPPPNWMRAYVFGPAASADLRSGVEGPDAEQMARERSEDLADQLRTLAATIAARPLLPLWRLGRFPACLLAAEDRYLIDHLGAAMDVKHCVHLFREGAVLYRFFWSRLVAVERRMLDRMRLLADSNIERIQDAMDPVAVRYLEGCARLWMQSLQSGGGSEESGPWTQLEFRKLVAEMDSALVAMLWMQSVLPGVDEAIRRVVPMSFLELFPKTADALASQRSPEHESLWDRQPGREQDERERPSMPGKQSWLASRYGGTGGTRSSDLGRSQAWTAKCKSGDDSDWRSTAGRGGQGKGWTDDGRWAP